MFITQEVKIIILGLLFRKMVDTWFALISMCHQVVFSIETSFIELTFIFFVLKKKLKLK